VKEENENKCPYQNIPGWGLSGRLLRKRLRAKNDRARTFSVYQELPKQAGANGIQLYSHLKFLNLKRFDEERNRLIWVSACYGINRNNITISELSAFFE